MFKPGDKVVSIDNSYRRRKGTRLEIVEDKTRDENFVLVYDPEQGKGTFYATRSALVLEEVYDSPLYQVMREK